MTSPEPHETTSILIIDPCVEPDSIISPVQATSIDYLYTVDPAEIVVKEFEVVPPICPVTYECIEITGPDEDVTCNDPNSIMSFNSATG